MDQYVVVDILEFFKARRVSVVVTEAMPLCHQDIIRHKLYYCKEIRNIVQILKSIQKKMFPFITYYFTYKYKL